MTLGGANVWTNFSYGSGINAPCGYLLNPEGSRLIFFDRCKKSPINNIKVFTHLFYTNHLGEPVGLKNTRLLDLNCAFETWNELMNNGWTEIKHNFE
tara:strand:+ start:4814 stop:5104 length:291 start_codon:yes stop_codon:yes gene_type:complete